MYSIGLFSQTYLVEYHFTRPNLGASKKIPESIRNKPSVLRMFQKERRRVLVFDLKHINGQSKFEIKYTTLDGEKDFDSRRLSGYGDTYKDFSKGCYIQVADFIEKNTAVREYFDDIFDWKIEPSRDSIIAGFYCKRATTVDGKDLIVAWYSRSVPIMDGPFKYAGLPGLIIQLESRFGIAQVADIQVVKNNKEKIVIPEKEKYISFKEMKESRTLTVKAKRIKKKNGQNRK